ncbi:MAG: hypothetical protein AAGD35_10060 [Actinomycetota bacterium]
MPDNEEAREQLYARTSLTRWYIASGSRPCNERLSAAKFAQKRLRALFEVPEGDRVAGHDDALKAAERDFFETTWELQMCVQYVMGPSESPDAPLDAPPDKRPFEFDFTPLPEAAMPGPRISDYTPDTSCAPCRPLTREIGIYRYNAATIDADDEGRPWQLRAADVLEQLLRECEQLHCPDPEELPQPLSVPNVGEAVPEPPPSSTLPSWIPSLPFKLLAMFLTVMLLGIAGWAVLGRGDGSTTDTDGATPTDSTGVATGQPASDGGEPGDGEPRDAGPTEGDASGAGGGGTEDATPEGCTEKEVGFTCPLGPAFGVGALAAAAEDAGGPMVDAEAAAGFEIAQDPFVGDVDVSWTADGPAFTVTFGDDVDPETDPVRARAVLYEDDSLVALVEASDAYHYTWTVQTDGTAAVEVSDMPLAVDGRTRTVTFYANVAVPTDWLPPEGELSMRISFDTVPPEGTEAAFTRTEMAARIEPVSDEFFVPGESSWAWSPALLRFAAVVYDDPTPADSLPAGFDGAAADDCPASPEEKAAAAFSREAFARLALDCLVFVHLQGGPAADVLADALRSFVAEPDVAVGCMAGEMAGAVTNVEELMVLAEVDVAGWPPDLLDRYAAALEECAPLRPFYTAIFAGFDFQDPACASLMTELVLDTYPWIEQLRGGVLDPDRRAAGQAEFTASVNQAYTDTGCVGA